MNKEQQEQLQFLGFLGIFKESIKIILSSPKIFTKITFAFILPLNLLVIANLGIFKFISNKIDIRPSRLNKDPYLFNSEKNLLYAFQATCFISVFQFSLLSISAVIYTTASIYTNNEFTFRKVLNVSLKVRKRLMVTMISRSSYKTIFKYVISFVITFVTLVSTFGLVFGFSAISIDDVKAAMSILTIFIVAFVFIGGLFMIMYEYWKLDNIVTVIENDYGFKAVKRSKELIEGNNIGTSVAISIVMGLCSTPSYVLGLQYNLSDGNVGFGMKIVYGIVCLVLNPLIMLCGLVVQTIFYFLCKSYHHESIDDFILTDHLDVSKSDEDYDPLKNEDVVIERRPYNV